MPKFLRLRQRSKVVLMKMMVMIKKSLKLKLRKKETSTPILKLNDLKKHKREETKRRKKTITQTINTFMKMLQRIQAAKIRSKSSSNNMPLNRKMFSLQMMKKQRFQKTFLLRFFKKRSIKIAEPLSLMN